MIKLKDILNERIPKLPRINMGFGEAQDYSKMMIIDNALINSKLASFKKVPLTTYRWPLAFTLSTKKVKIILNNHSVSLDD